MSNRQKPRVRPGGIVPSGAPKKAVVGRHARRPVEPVTLTWRKTGVPGAVLMTDPDSTGWHARVDDGALQLYVSHHSTTGWHLSMTHSGPRYPSWDELADARERFVPDEVTMAMVLPPKSEYVNLSENCLHLWEIRGEDW